MVPGLICPKLDILGQNGHFYAKIARNWIIIVISTLVYALVYNFAQWWFINYSKDIINVAQLKWYTICKFWAK